MAIADLYVNGAGRDDAEGSRADPLRSIGAAASRARTLLGRGSVVRIAVCTGNYDERRIALVGGIEVRGNYDCSSWTRTDADATIVGVSTPSASIVNDAEPGADLFDLDDDVTGTPLLEGLQIICEQTSTAIVALGKSAVRQVSIVNQSAPSTSVPITAGIALSGAGAILENSTVSVTFPTLGADGGGPAVSGSAVAVLATDGMHTIRRNSLSVLSVLGGCAGVSLSSGSAELSENQIELAACVSNVATATSAFGVLAADSATTSTRNSVYIEGPGNVAGYTIVYGFKVQGTGSFVSDGDRIRAPSVLAESKIGGLDFDGFRGNGSVVSIVNASVLVNAPSGFTLGNAAGIRLTDPSRAFLAHNSMYLSGEPLDPTKVHAFTLDARALDGNQPSAVVLESNLLIGAMQPRLASGSCTRPGFEQIRGTRYAAQGVLVTGEGCDDAGLAEITQGAAASGNKMLTCPDGCAGLVDLTWGSVRVRGLALSDAGCANADLAVPFTTRVTVDGTGSARHDGGTRAGAFDGCP